jgi:hypothetical protein
MLKDLRDQMPGIPPEVRETILGNVITVTYSPRVALRLAAVLKIKYEGVQLSLPLGDGNH